MRRPPDFFWQVLSRLMLATHIGDTGEKKFLLRKKQHVRIDIQKLSFLFSLEKVLRQERFSKNRGLSPCRTSSGVALFAFDTVLMNMYRRRELPEFLDDQHLSYLKLIALLSRKPVKVSLKSGLAGIPGFYEVHRHCRSCQSCVKESRHWRNYWLEALDRAVINKARFLSKTL